jgi:hypothetical protein
MVDRVGTLEEIAFKMASGRVRIASMKAQDEWDASPPPTRRELLRERAAALELIAKG